MLTNRHAAHGEGETNEGSARGTESTRDEEVEDAEKTGLLTSRQRGRRGRSIAASASLCVLLLLAVVGVASMVITYSSNDQIETSQIAKWLTDAKDTVTRFATGRFERDDDDNSNTAQRHQSVTPNPTTPPPTPMREPQDAETFAMFANTTLRRDDDDDDWTQWLLSANHSGMAHTPIGRLVMSRIPKMCTKNWDLELIKRFEERCGYWADVMGEWDSRAAPDSRGAATYACINEKMCNGLGDRLAGMMGALSLGIRDNRAFRVYFPGMASIFTQPCLLRGKRAAWTEHDAVIKNACKATSEVQCSHIMKLDCLDSSHPRVTENLHRACLPSPGTCHALARRFPTTLNAADMFGCPLRMMLEPSDQFLRKLKVPFRMSNGDSPHVKRMTIENIVNEVTSRYYVIGIHFRLADQLAFKLRQSKATNVVNEDNPEVLVPFKCAETIQSFDEGRVVREIKNKAKQKGEDGRLEDEWVVEGKPVRWFLASDSEALRELALRKYGARLLMVDFAPRHVALDASKGNNVVTLERTVAEWYLLGRLCDKIVMNRIGKKGLYRGRVSAFPKTAWVYNMKHEFYDAGNCLRRSIPLDGTWRDGGVVNVNCLHSPVFKRKKTAEYRAQPHLDALKKRGHEFAGGGAWVERGEIRVAEGERVDLGKEEEEGEEEEEEGTS